MRSWWCLCCFAIGLAAFGPGAGAAGAKLSAAQRQALATALAGQHERYDPAERMIRRPFSSPGYHTSLKGGMVHPTRDSLRYAVACLDTGDERLLERAQDVIGRVVALQDQDPASRTYGIWSWFLEEPLAKMSPPDWNWADFCGHLLLQAVIDHGERLGPELRRRVDESIAHACRSIRRRNVGPGYTNIALLGTYVTLVAAETYGDDDLKGYAIARLRRFHEHTKEKGGFSEYNSPTYTMVSLRAIAEMLRDVKDAEARKLLEELHRLAWQEIADHFHPPTRQWAGPHSRSYSTLLRRGTLASIERGLGGGVDLGDLDGEFDLESYRVDLACPADLWPRFARLDEARQVRRIVEPGKPPVEAITFLNPACAFSTVSRGDFWNQRRGIVAYWGTAERPSYLHARMLRDGYDFAASHFQARQSHAAAVVAIGFATDGGNTHVSLDRLKDGVVRMKDLRLRFEFGGAAGSAPPPAAPAALDAPVAHDLGAARLYLRVPFAKFGGQAVRWERGSDPRAGIAFLDLVLFHADEEREVRLGDPDVAAVALAIAVVPGDQWDGSFDERLGLDARVIDGRLCISSTAICDGTHIAARPAPRSRLVRAD